MTLRKMINAFSVIVLFSMFCTKSQASETEVPIDDQACVSASVLAAQPEPIAEIAKRPNFALSYTFYVLDYKCDMDE